jgi:hypothetical protein
MGVNYSVCHWIGMALLLRKQYASIIDIKVIKH